MTKTPDIIKTAKAHGNYVRGSASKVRRVCPDEDLSWSY